MTYIPRNLKDYPNKDTSLPLYLNTNRLDKGYPAHRHDFLEFSYVIEGRGKEMINGATHPMVPGTLTFILPYQIHEISTEPGNTLVLINCNFSMDLLMSAGARVEVDGLLTDEENLSSFIQLHGEDHSQFCALLKDMMEEYRGSERWREAMVKAKLTEVLVRFDRHRRKGQPSPVPARPGISKASPTWRIIHHIQRNYQEELTLADLAKSFAMSMSRICDRIKETTGQTFVQFVNELRLRHACSLLVSTEMSIAEIAYEVGFGSYKTFARLFRVHKGISPTDYRNSAIN
jgi:AraC-like DNA-binding protein